MDQLDIFRQEQAEDHSCRKRKIHRTRIGYGQAEEHSSRNITWTIQIYFKYTLRNDRGKQRTTAAGREKVHNIDQFQVEHLSTNPDYSFEHFPSIQIYFKQKITTTRREIVHNMDQFQFWIIFPGPGR